MKAKDLLSTFFSLRLSGCTSPCAESEAVSIAVDAPPPNEDEDDEDNSDCIDDDVVAVSDENVPGEKRTHECVGTVSPNIGCDVVNSGMIGDDGAPNALGITGKRMHVEQISNEHTRHP